MKTPSLFILLFFCTTAVANHSFGGLDMCALYPETMPPGIKADQLPGNNKTDNVLLQTYCTQCHELPGPGRHTAEEWPQVLNHMFTLMDVASKFGGLMGHVKNPNTTERRQLSNYLQQHALRSINHKPQGYGATAFENHCSNCHQLPDPAYYATDNWPDIIKRMQHNMTIMKYSLPSSETMMQIQVFLQQYNRNNSSIDFAVSQQSELNNKQNSSSSQTRSSNTGSWLALGPFSLLILLGLTRWWFNQHKRQTR